MPVLAHPATRGAAAARSPDATPAAPVLGSYGTELKVGSSYAVYAAAASLGHVRSPACFMRYERCMPRAAGVNFSMASVAPEANVLSAIGGATNGMLRDANDAQHSAYSVQAGVRWHGYAHPTCKECRNLRAEPRWPLIQSIASGLHTTASRSV